MGYQIVELEECEEIAKKVGYDSMEFFLVGSKHDVKCKWLDAYFGMFRPDGEKKFLSSRAFVAVDIFCLIM